jgi:hypothetical protein
MSLTHDGRILATEYDRWNEAMKRSIDIFDRQSQKLDLLSPAERSLSERESINVELYLAMKDPIIREYTFRDGFQGSRLFGSPPRVGRAVTLTYDLLRE